MYANKSSGYIQCTIDEAFEFALDRLGYKKLKQEQEKVLRVFVSGNDVFAALPTGYGKSRASHYCPTNVGIAATRA